MCVCVFFFFHLEYKNQAALARRRSSARRGSILTPPPTNRHEVPWDIFDRLLLPLLCCHAAAIMLSGLLNLLRISHVSTFALFIWFALSTVGAILFYHHLKVGSFSLYI